MKERGHTTIGVPRNIFCKNVYKGQLTIFVIVGIILVSLVALFFILRGGISQEFIISDCIKEVGVGVIDYGL